MLVDFSLYFGRILVDCSFNFLKCCVYLELTLLVGFRVSQPCASVSQLPAALRRPKNTPLDLLSMYLVNFVTRCRFQPPLQQAPCVCVAAACSTSATSENTPLYFWRMYLVDLVNVHRFVGSPIDDISAKSTNNQQSINSYKHGELSDG